MEQEVSAALSNVMPGFRYQGKAAYVPVIRQKNGRPEAGPGYRLCGTVSDPSLLTCLS
ncbi:hypothetical protein [Paenibacillus sp. Y412MC10]|uniref:hypothetical protein n=1 Tax=Geobacillus sp. (strain Y412MC10) TaxID=481743 RepID=UPI001642A8AB|nr:hypothetical protein [Paenibacillus sp. Y412MC10]